MTEIFHVPQTLSFSADGNKGPATIYPVDGSIFFIKNVTFDRNEGRPPSLVTTALKKGENIDEISCLIRPRIDKSFTDFFKYNLPIGENVDETTNSILNYYSAKIPLVIISQNGVRISDLLFIYPNCTYDLGKKLSSMKNIQTGRWITDVPFPYHLALNTKKYERGVFETVLWDIEYSKKEKTIPKWKQIIYGVSIYDPTHIFPYDLIKNKYRSGKLDEGYVRSVCDPYIRIDSIA